MPGTISLIIDKAVKTCDIPSHGTVRAKLANHPGDYRWGKMESIRKHERRGRPLGDDHFVDRLESETARHLRKKKPGPKGPRKNE